MIKTLFFSVGLFFGNQVHAVNSQSFFKDSVLDYKTDFKNRSQYLVKKNPLVKIGSAKIENASLSSAQQSYDIDYLLIPSEKRKNLIIIQSGIHGIEGLAGAGIQNFLLEYLHTQNKKFSNSSFLYIHLVNPYGAEIGRRTNLNNVDLNRNFVLSTAEFSSKNEDYEKINYFLNPETPFSEGLFNKVSFYFRSLLLVARFSTETLRRSILKGQYTYPKGIYFGGQNYQPEYKALKAIWDAETSGYENIFYIDLHTGYGEKGRLHLMGGDPKSEVSKTLSQVFSPTEIDFANDKNFYETTGDVTSYFSRFYSSNAKLYPITFEFGTIGSLSTLGSIESLYRMVSENQKYHGLNQSSKPEPETQKLFRELFYPSDFQWRDQVLKSTQIEINKVLKYSEL